MLEIEFPCTNNYYCKDGMVPDMYAKVEPGKDKPLVTCNVCNGTGKRIKHFGATTLIDVNMGDHGETRTEVIEFDSELTIKELLSKIFGPKSKRTVTSVTFSPGHVYD